MDRNGGFGPVVAANKSRSSKRVRMMGTSITTCAHLSIVPRFLVLLSFLSANTATTINNSNNNYLQDPLNRAELPQHDDQILISKQQKPLQPRIINGEDVTDPDRYPWFVHVRGSTPDNQPVLEACGGSLIAPDLVLTAAHCEDGDFALVGASTLPVSGTRYEVVTNVRHPNYPQELQVDFDIMITQLDEVVPPDIAKPIALNWDENFPGDVGTTSTGYPFTIIGFGSILGGPEYGGPEPIIQGPDMYLQRAPTEYVSFEDCAVASDPETGQRYGVSTNNTVVQPWWFCTLYNDPITTATCYRDSGGPVFEERDGTPEGDLLVAVISGGAQGYCGNPYLPLWNNRISYHKDWIVQTGCELSTAPPAEWNCESGGIAPDGPVPPGTATPAPSTRPPSPTPPSPTTLPSTPRPDRPPTSSPTPPQVIPTLSPSTRSPTLEPTKQTMPPTESPESTSPQEPSSEPSASPNVFPPSIESSGPTTPATTPTTSNDGDDDDNNICPICGEGQQVTSSGSIVLVPTLGTFTCAELEAMSAAGEINESQCSIVQLLTSSACDCQALPSIPTVATVPSTQPPLGGPTSPPSTPTTPTRPPSITMSPSIVSPEDCEPFPQDDAQLVDVVVSIDFDSKPYETGWYINDENNSCFRVGIPAMAYKPGQTSVEERVFLKRGGRYRFVIEDSQGDGLCCGNVDDGGNDGSPGSYTLSHGDIILASGDGDFGFEEATLFTAPDI